MKIKLNRDLWNHKKGDIIEASDNHGNWAVDRGHASLVEIEPIKAKQVAQEPALNKAIEPKYKRNKI